jgi:hypothetical protein
MFPEALSIYPKLLAMVIKQRKPAPPVFELNALLPISTNHGDPTFQLGSDRLGTADFRNGKSRAPASYL